ncbi:MAG: hypothetical protein FJY82_03200 [Candidatus Aminicenantes bacterium]|nr:hypothetical protein [Candidatus Aminicenantes bacterium]
MKAIWFVLLSAFVFLPACATGPRAKEWVPGAGAISDESIAQDWTPLGEQTYPVEGETYDRVWEACEQALINLGFRFEKADKEAGEIRVRGPYKSQISKEGIGVEDTEMSHLTVTVVKAEDNILVKAALPIVKAGTPNRDLVNKAKNEVDRFFARLKKELKS